MPFRTALPRLTVLLLGIAGVSFSAAQNIAPAELRHMTAAQFQRHLDEEGVQAFTSRVIKDTDPHSPEEPNYDIILEHVAEGSPGWLHIAAEIGPYIDARFSEGLRVALADALIENPSGVLRLIGSEEHFNEACGYPFVHQTEHYLHRHQRAALLALERVRSPNLAIKKAACRKQLLQMPVNTASGSQQ